MITLYFVRAWLKWLAGFALLLVFERALLGWTSLLVLIGMLTILLFALASWLMWGDWRSARRGGYRFDFIRDVTRR